MNFLGLMKPKCLVPALDFAPGVLSNQLEAAGLNFRAAGG